MKYFQLDYHNPTKNYNQICLFDTKLWKTGERFLCGELLSKEMLGTEIERVQESR